jgi:predicted dehydrogenase
MIMSGSRRRLIGSAAAWGACSIVPRHVLGGPGYTAPSEKLNIACIGIGGKGFDNVRNVMSENIVALCDVDARRGAEAFKMFPRATQYRDYRMLFDKEEKNIDAVVVSTPDHHHIPASVMAMRRGKHVYCEKPLGQNIAEIRLATKVAAETGVATQMGNGAHSGSNYRGVAKMIRDGVIGEVREVHCWCDEAWEPGDRPKHTPPIPQYLDWDLWLGPAPVRPYHPCYHPLSWRNWWDFGNGRLGDMGCHMLDLPFMALELKYPLTAEADCPRPAHPESACKSMTCRWTFPARDKMPPVKLTWYHGDRRPPLQAAHHMPDYPEGTLFVGSKGMLIADYGQYKLYPEEKFSGVRRPQVPRIGSHHDDWIEACKTGRPTGTRFDYSGPLAETVLLGNVAYRAGQKIEWDARRMSVTNVPEANRFIQRENRKGWEL